MKSRRKPPAHWPPNHAPTPVCWCGNTDLQVFSPDYLRCSQCETLVLRCMPARDVTRVRDDKTDLYGRDYHLKHLPEDFGYPDLATRVRTDLPERCLHWFRTLLKYKVPPGKALELGSAHGAFVALLRWSGFDAVGLELSPWMVDFAKRTFDVPMLSGPIEDQTIKPHSLDVIALMDVLEHLPSPLETMEQCLQLLKKDGVLVIQTPRYPEGKTFEAMVADGDRFQKQFKPGEHLYLFSRKSVRELFQRLGANHLIFEPPIFAYYDMFFIASRAPLAVCAPEAIQKVLSATPNGRGMQAMLDLDDQFKQLQASHMASEADRAARLENIRRLEQLLEESERDRAARLGVMETQGAQIASLQSEVGNLKTEHKLVQTRLTELQQQLQASEADRAARGREIDTQRQAISEADAERQRQQAEISYLKASGEEMQTAWHRLGKSQTYRVIRALGQWRSLDRYVDPVTSAGSAAHGPSNNHSPKTLRCVVVDLTPVLPGADNGGAKLVAMELVRHLAQLTPSCEWILLTSEIGHADLAPLDSHNVRRVCARPDAVRPFGKSPDRARGLARLLPRSGKASRRNFLRQLDADVVFCPFTTARFFDPRVPMVTILHDLQYLAYPEFFSSEERAHSDREFRDVCRFATRVVCISDHVRRSVLQHGMVDPSRVTTIHTSLFRRLTDGPAAEDVDVRQRLGLQAGRYLLYPANFWPHKNHEMLLTAFGMYRARHPASDLKLVCTGGLGARREQLQEAVERMGMAGHVAVIGFLPDKEFAALLRACRALVFPSLFEGFGMPPLEAMAFDKPVLCSNLTSLPEVVGDAALLFDPRKPMEIVQAIEQIESNPELVAELIRRGQNRLTAFDDATGMARRYLQVIQDALTGDNHFAPAIHGVFSDGWTGERVTVLHGPSAAPRYLEMTLHAPPWLPCETISVRLASPGCDGSETYAVKRDQTVTLRHRLPTASGSVEVQIHPTFQPLAQRMGTDMRVLGCLCRSCRILAPDETVELFAEVSQA